jgi:hypothetical protein
LEHAGRGGTGASRRHETHVIIPMNEFEEGP